MSRHERVRSKLLVSTRGRIGLFGSVVWITIAQLNNLNRYSRTSAKYRKSYYQQIMSQVPAEALGLLFLKILHQSLKLQSYQAPHLRVKRSFVSKPNQGKGTIVEVLVIAVLETTDEEVVETLAIVMETAEVDVAEAVTMTETVIEEEAVMTLESQTGTADRAEEAVTTTAVITGTTDSE